MHFDQVERLGDFFEVEVVLRPSDSREEAKNLAFNILAFLVLRQRTLCRLHMLTC